MKIENNCLVTDYCTYPFDEIELAGEAYEEYHRRLKENGLSDTTGNRVRMSRFLSSFTFEIKISNDFALEHNIHHVDGVAILVPSKDEKAVRECWQAIYDYKEMQKDVAVHDEVSEDMAPQSKHRKQRKAKDNE